MPQLDFFIFFGLYGSFLIHIVGMFYFSAYLVPLVISVAKIYGSRTFYYCISIVDVLSISKYDLEIACAYYHCLQATIIYNSIVDANSLCMIHISSAITE
jgi:hypothetical protein